MSERYSCSTSSLEISIVFVSVLDFSHSNRCVVVFGWYLNLQFPKDIQHGASFHMLICQLYIFGEVFGSFFNQLFNS